MNTGVSADDNVTRAAKKPMECFFHLKGSFAALTPSIFRPLYIAFVRPHLEYAIQASSPILFWDSQAQESVQKLAVNSIYCCRDRLEKGNIYSKLAVTTAFIDRVMYCSRLLPQPHSLFTQEGVKF